MMNKENKLAKVVLKIVTCISIILLATFTSIYERSAVSILNRYPLFYGIMLVLFVFSMIIKYKHATYVFLATYMILCFSLLYRIFFEMEGVFLFEYNLYSHFQYIKLISAIILVVCVITFTIYNMKKHPAFI